MPGLPDKTSWRFRVGMLWGFSAPAASLIGLKTVLTTLLRLGSPFDASFSRQIIDVATADASIAQFPAS